MCVHSFQRTAAYEDGHTPICFCCFLMFQCRHSAKLSNQSVTCPVLLMDGTGHLLVVTGEKDDIKFLDMLMPLK